MPDGDLTGLPAGAYDLILSAFTFDNIPTLVKKVTLLTALKQLLKPGAYFGPTRSVISEEGDR